VQFRYKCSQQRGKLQGLYIEPSTLSLVILIAITSAVSSNQLLYKHSGFIKGWGGSEICSPQDNA